MSEEALEACSCRLQQLPDRSSRVEFQEETVRGIGGQAEAGGAAGSHGESSENVVPEQKVGGNNCSTNKKN